MKRQRFLARGGTPAYDAMTAAGGRRAASEGPRLGGALGGAAQRVVPEPIGCDFGGPPPLSPGPGPCMPTSPLGAPPSPGALGQLVAGGYQAPPRADPGLPPRPGGRPTQPPPTGFSADVAQQWSKGGGGGLETYQQHNDPNYVGRRGKPQGYRVSQVPGGHSSISLSWGDSGRETSAPPATGHRAASPRGRRDPSPLLAGGLQAALSVGRAASPVRGRTGRSSSPMGAVQVGGGEYGGPRGGYAGPPVSGCGVPPGASGRPPPYGGDGRQAPAASPPSWGGAPVHHVDYGQAGGMAFGGQAGGRTSSNSYACGSNQNYGNVLTDKPTSRVLQVPGGRSQISLG